jgi:hypothetical protein
MKKILWYVTNVTKALVNMQKTYVSVLEVLELTFIHSLKHISHIIHHFRIIHHIS